MNNPDFLIIGGGPAGLMAALAASDFGIKPLLIDENQKLGGQLIKQTHMFFGSKAERAGTRGLDIGIELAGEMEKRGIEIWTNSSAVGCYPDGTVAVLKNDKLHGLKPKAVLAATGASENFLAFPGNDLPGVYGAGAVQTLMNVYGIRPGKSVLMIGSGNIGLIVSYQLLQAGVQVKAVIEGLPCIGGYLVHASKIARAGVPILIRHTILEATGEDQVKGAVISKIDDEWQPVIGSEKKVDCDTICLAVGLTPLTEILWQAGCQMNYVPELGGQVAWHDELMMTSVPGIFTAGDVTGIEEATTAMLEGELAGLGAVKYLKGGSKELQRRVDVAACRLTGLRAGPFGQKAREGKRKLAECRTKTG
ncbi:FAD-dependent oxidoreductase [candidate division TA06 bacterium]|uniref:FAD-dependent oxidoreductase n=1 Tax=candidate division TA06 bacterium TaxID=2250710 RepID=A0A933MKN8_UNCT6|nr:FAD-dependent oxidoreductase [candidate division TA06 bacterium]